jgi:hypothetical protein
MSQKSRQKLSAMNIAELEKLHEQLHREYQRRFK